MESKLNYKNMWKMLKNEINEREIQSAIAVVKLPKNKLVDNLKYTERKVTLLEILLLIEQMEKGEYHEQDRRI